MVAKVQLGTARECVRYSSPFVLLFPSFHFFSCQSQPAGTRERRFPVFLIFSFSLASSRTVWRFERETADRAVPLIAYRVAESSLVARGESLADHREDLVVYVSHDQRR